MYVCMCVYIYIYIYLYRGLGDPRRDLLGVPRRSRKGQPGSALMGNNDNFSDVDDDSINTNGKHHSHNII